MSSGGADRPGFNTEVRPEAAPVWMNQLLDRVRQHGIKDSDMHGGSSRHENWEQQIQHEKKAAVLMLFSGAETSASLPNDAAVLLTHRTPTMRSHSGQIAFPGGRLDPTDVNAVDCALREAWEETGLDRGTVTPLAELAEVHIRATGYPVHPVLGHWHTPSPVGVASPNETDEVFDVPVFDLIEPAHRLMVGWRNWHGPAFRINDYVIWGFTGGLLSATLRMAGWEEEWNQQEIHDLNEVLAASRNNESFYH